MHETGHTWSEKNCLFSWSTININSEKEIEVQPENLESKAASHQLLPQTESEMAILPPGISE